MATKQKNKNQLAYPIHSIWSQWWRWFMLLALIGFILLAYGFYVQQPLRVYWQIGDVLIYIIAGGLVLLAAIGLFGMKSYEITEHDVIIRNYFLKIIRKIPRFEFDSWYEIEYEDKQGNITSKELTLITKHNKKVQINSSYCLNYGQLKNVLIKGLKKNKSGENKILRRWSILAGTFFIGFALLLFLNSDIQKLETKTREDFEIINGTIKSINIESHGKKHRSYSLEILVKEYPDFTFKMSTKIWSLRTLKMAKSKLSVGDGIRLAIDKEAYNKKISKTAKLTFWDKHSHYHLISFAGLYKGEQMLLPLSDYLVGVNEPNSKSDNVLVIVIVLVFASLGGLFFYIGFVRK